MTTRTKLKTKPQIKENVKIKEKVVKKVKPTIKTKNSPPSPRYAEFCNVLGFLAFEQLNLKKNRTKGPLENIDIYSLLELCRGEIDEIEAEFLSPMIDPQRIIEEVGDAAAYLVGVLTSLEQLMEEHFS